MKQEYVRSLVHKRRTVLYRKRSIQRKRKPKRQGSRNQSGKRIPVWMVTYRLDRNRMLRRCRKGEVSWHMCPSPRT